MTRIGTLVSPFFLPLCFLARFEGRPSALPFKGRVGWGWCSPPRHSGGSRNPFCFWLLALRDNRLTSVCVSSTIHGRRLLSFACPKESNQRKRHPRIRALGCAEGSLRADGFGPQGILPCCPNRRDPSRRPRFARLFRPPFAAAQREPEKKEGKNETRALSPLPLAGEGRVRAIRFYAPRARSKCRTTSAIAGPSTSTCIAKSLSAPTRFGVKCGAADNGSTM